MYAIRAIIYIVLICANIAPVVAANLNDLIISYNYDFYNGTINVTSENDHMIDKNSNNKNDTLIVNITTDAATGTYRFIVEIIDENGILTNNTEKTLAASDSSANINFPSELLSQTKFNYSIRINDNDNNLVFRKSSIDSQNYKNYETGTNITKITDENINADFIRINLTIDSSKAENANITVTLAYNSLSISKTEEKSLSNGIQTTSIVFDNETIKSTHHNSNFLIDTVVIGNKIFDFDQNTSLYNYEDFAKTSYINSIADGRIDADNNNLSEFLEINFTLEIKTADTYTINYDLYDQFDNFVANLSKTRLLSAGEQNIQTLINGSKIYNTKINGPYVLSFVKLNLNNETKDIIFNAHTTNQTFYTDYEKPNLPDLKVTISKDFNNIDNITNITINLSNIGAAPAFNIFLDIFDNQTYNNNATLAFLNKNKFVIYNYNAANTSNATFFTAIVDFDNLVDESDETNNMVNSLKTIANDFDGDGIDDGIDTLIGNANSINTTLPNLTIKIGNLTDLSQVFNGTWKISFDDNGTTLIEFDFNLSKILNLTKIMMEKQSNSSFGYTLVNGLSLESTKTVYVERVDSSVNGICIKDADISSISQISDNCNDISEIKIECDGTLQSSYVCSYNSTASKYKITGLNNSGLKQINYAKPTASTSAATGGGGGSNSGGGSGSCLEKWQCNEWLKCINNLQTRACNEINRCNTLFSKPSETRLCTINEQSRLQSTEKNNLDDKEPKNDVKYFLPDITGFLLNPPENTKPTIGAFIVFFVIVAGLLGYFYFIYRK
jgi:hypothetical protein